MPSPLRNHLSLSLSNDSTISRDRPSIIKTPISLKTLANNPSPPPNPSMAPLDSTPPQPSPSSIPSLNPSSAPPVRRSLRLAAGASSPLPATPPPPPPTPAMDAADMGSRVSKPSDSSDGERRGSSASPDLTLGLGFPTPRRRSLRLAAVANPSVLAPPARVSEPAEENLEASMDLTLYLSSSGEGRMYLRSESKAEQKGKGYSYDEKGKGKLVLEVEPLENGCEEMAVDLNVADEGRVFSERRFSAQEKGKDKLIVNKDWLSMGWTESADVKGDEEPLVVCTDVLLEEEHPPNEGGSAKRRRTTVVKGWTESRREADRNKAIELAPKFAFFKPEENGSEEEEDDTKEAGGDEDWPGPFSTAMKIIEEQEAMREARNSGSASKKVEANKVGITWAPAKDRGFRPRGRTVPSLRELSIKILCENAEEIESLDGVPDSLKQMLTRMLCHSRKMSAHVLGLLVSGSSTKIQLTDCTWATDDQMEGALAVCTNEILKVVQLDMCGRCMTDYVLRGTLARSPNCLPLLTTLSLKGAYRLTDDGINTIASSAPSLSSINLSQCSLLSSHGIMGLANKLGSVLKELHIDDCQSVDAMLILPALEKLQVLEVLSAARVETVCDKFVKRLISFSGPNMKVLMFDGCRKLSPISMKIIGESCSRLHALDLCYLNRLNDSAIGYIANGCRSLQKLKLRRNAFSDEALAAFLEASGDMLTELSLNSVVKVGQHTAVAISRRCSYLRSLDLSFCRMMTDEALGLIADSCPNLRILKLFGCTQVTGLFLEGHSNSLVKIIGLKEPILEVVEMPDFL